MEARIEKIRDYRLATLMHYSNLRVQYMEKARSNRHRATYWVYLARNAQRNLTMLRRKYAV